MARRRPDCVVALGGGSTIGLGKAIAVRTGRRPGGGADDLRRLGDDRHPRRDRRRAEDHPPRPGDPAGDGDLRRGADARPAAGLDRDLGAERARACGGGALCPRPQPGADADRRRGGGGARRGAAAARRGAGGPDGPGAGALRRLALRRGARRHDHGAAPQALPRARRLLRAAACRDARGDAAACRGLQRRGGGGAARAGERGAGRGGAGAGALRRWRGRIGAPRALRELGLAEGDLDRAAEIAAEDPYWNPRPVERDGDPRASRRGLGGRAAGG